MDIEELKGGNPKMLAECASDENNMASDVKHRAVAEDQGRKKHHSRRKNQAFCEFDILAAYNMKKKHRSSKRDKEHTKEHHKEHREHREHTSKLPRKVDKEKSELSKKIEDLTARNEKIKELLKSNVNEEEGTKVTKQDNDGEQGVDREREEKRRRHREHRSRRAECCPGHGNTHHTVESIEKSNQKIKEKEMALKLERQDVSLLRIVTDPLEKLPKSGRRERSATFAGTESMKVSKVPRITVRLRSNSERASLKNEKGPSHVEEIEKHVVESKSQLVKVTNYQKSKIPEFKSRDNRDSKEKPANIGSDIITVYENSNLFYETDSIVSKETLKKSKTNMRIVQRIEDREDVNDQDYPIRDTKPKKMEAARVLQEYDRPTREERIVKPPKTAIARKELSFSNLNLEPNIYHYHKNRAHMATTQTSVSRIETPGFGTFGIGVYSSYFNNPAKSPVRKSPDNSAVLSQTAIAMRDIMQVQEHEQKCHQHHNNAIKSKIMENSSFVSDTTRKSRPTIKSAMSRNSRFHRTRSDATDRIVEIASKTFNDQKVSFTVEGVEPPKRLKNNNETYRNLKMEHIFNIQLFPGMTMTQSDLKESDLQLLSHGTERSKRYLKSSQRKNESQGTFEGSGNFFSYIRGLDNTNSEFKPKESSEVSYKFKKKYWSSKELPKKKGIEKKKRDKEKKAKVSKTNKAVQTGLDNLREVVHDKDVGVSTGDYHFTQSKDIQVQVQLLQYAPRVESQELRKSSQSETNINLIKDKFRKGDFVERKKYPTYENLTPPIIPVSPIIPSFTKPETFDSSGENIPEVCTPTRKKLVLEPSPLSPRTRQPRSDKKPQKPRNGVHTRTSTPLNISCHAVASTGSIQQAPKYCKKIRSKSLSHDREALVEKININKKTIKHHHQEIAALEKCLNEILHRLGEDDASISKMAVKGDADSEISRSSCLCEKLPIRTTFTSLECSTATNNSSLVPENTFVKPPRNKASNPIELNEKHHRTKSRTKPFTKSRLSTSKFYRRKVYGESVRKRYRKKKNADDLLQLHKVDTKILTPVRIRSVYKNPKGFISSATSLSSKISDFGSSSTYPQSIPSLNICYSMLKPIKQCISRGYGNEYRDHHLQKKSQQGMIKKKHKLYSNEVNYSKKKTNSIFEMLMEYINLTEDQSPIDPILKPKYEGNHSPVEQNASLMSEESRVVILSVSSVKLRKSSSNSKINFNSKKYKKIKPLVIENASDSDEKEIPNKPFFIARHQQEPVEPLKPKFTPKKVPTSDDSLEFDQNLRAPDLCPLTAIFNFEPQKRDFLVYNTEVISPDKPNIVIEELPPSPRSDISTRHSPKLMTIQEEKTLINPESLGSKEREPSREKKDMNSKPMSSFKSMDKTDNKVAGVPELSPILNRHSGGYPSYDSVMKSLERIDLGRDTLQKPKLTTFHCNDRECSNLIFNYTSKKDMKDNNKDKLSSMEDYSKASSSCERQDRHSSAYHTMTTIMDSKPGSIPTPSESDTAVKNESGYESGKKTTTFKKFFKRRMLLDVFTKLKRKTSECDGSVAGSIAMSDGREPACIVSQESFDNRLNAEPSEDDLKVNLDQTVAEKCPYVQSKTVLWFNFKKKKRAVSQGCDPWCLNKVNEKNQHDVPTQCISTCHKYAKCMNTTKSLLKTECPCSLPFEEQKAQCKKYASKVLLEAAEREKGYKKQYDDFQEMPLKVLMGTKTCPCSKLNQGCIKTYTNKVAGIQVKSLRKSETIQVEKSSSISVPETTIPASKPEEPSYHSVYDRASTSYEEPSYHSVYDRASTSYEEPLKHSSSAKLDKTSEEVVLDPDDPESPVPPRRSTLDPSKETLNDVSVVRTYTDKELFDRLLRDFERKDLIAERLSSDEVFQKAQMDAVNSGMVPDLQVQLPHVVGSEEERMRGPRFSDRPKPRIYVTTDTTVQPDDIGTCFARGFRPDNLMLSGDACFHINKQDKIKMSPYMLKNTESIIDFSERETPLDFLLALGFMVDEASNALKDNDIRSRLLAAITEARVWINKITTTQGTLLYLVAYKSRPETMRYFLQLVEAIINRRINNAIRLDGFLRVLEDVESGRIQMINILGEDKFEDEENEEKIIKKQLKNLFITVYNVAEKEAAASGRSLSSNQISLLRILVAKYRAGLHPHLELIARYIGQGLLENNIQLEAAMIFLSRLGTSEVKLKEFENYCGITCQLQDT